jgi:Tropinone reductase 1
VEYTPEEQATLMSTNWTSHFALCQQLKPLLTRGALERGSAAVVLNTSVAGVVAISSGSLYAAAKVRGCGLTGAAQRVAESVGVCDAYASRQHTLTRRACSLCTTQAALNQLARNLACEWGREGIRVNALAPWYTDTPLVRPRLQAHGLSSHSRTRLRARGRLI